MSEPQPLRQHPHPTTCQQSSALWNELRITALEADLAYFNARLELIGTPTTINQKAQLATFRLLIQSTTRILHRLRHPLSDGL
jgi:hypothetical protein